MKLYKLLVTGNDREFNIEYNFSTNFVSYNKFDFTGSEQEKYDEFLVDLKPNASSQPINIKVKMSTQSIDRAIPGKEIVSITDINEFIKRLSK